MLKLNNCLIILIKRLFNSEIFYHLCAMESKDKRILIIEKAEKLFAAHGFSGTSVREIANAAEVNVAMISYYFGSKEKLLMEIFAYRGDYLKTRIDDLLNNKSLSWWNKLDLIIDHYVEKIKANKYLHQIISKEVDLNSDSEISLFIQERKKEHFKILAQFVNQGKQQDAFNKDADILCLHTLLIALPKQILFSQDFMRNAIEEETGTTPNEKDLIELTKDYLKVLFRKILEIK